MDATNTFFVELAMFLSSFISNQKQTLFHTRQ